MELKSEIYRMSEVEMAQVAFADVLADSLRRDGVEGGAKYAAAKKRMTGDAKSSRRLLTAAVKLIILCHTACPNCNEDA